MGCLTNKIALVTGAASGIGLKTAERPVEGAINVFASVAARIRVARFGIEGKFRGQDDSVTQTALDDKFPDQLFALAAGISVGGVNEIPAGFEVSIEEAARNVLLRSPSPLGAESHGAETEWGDAQSGSSERFVFVR